MMYNNETLVALIKQGHTEYMSELYMNNRAFIVWMIKRMSIHPDDYEDALQDAYFGLAAAVKAYDESSCNKFIAYAKYHLRSAINRGRSRTRRLPDWLIASAVRLTRLQNSMSLSLERTPTIAEIAREAGMSVKDIQYILNAVKPPHSLEMPIGEDITLSQIISDDSIDFESKIAEADERRYIRKIVDALPEDERRVIRLYYFEGFTYKEIAELQGLTISRVRYLIAAAIRRMRSAEWDICAQ